MFKVGDKVFDNKRGYGEGVVYSCNNVHVIVKFYNAGFVTYFKNGRWNSEAPITLFKKEEKMKNYYYVGQKVSNQAFGDGVVESIASVIEDYPIFVNFKNCSYCFTFDGRLQKDQFPTLSQKPHIPLELEEVVSFEKGELVWAKVCVWEARYFSHFDEKEYHVFSNQQKSGTTLSLPLGRIRKFSDNPLL